MHIAFFRTDMTARKRRERGFSFAMQAILVYNITSYIYLQLTKACTVCKDLFASMPRKLWVVLLSRLEYVMVNVDESF